MRKFKGLWILFIILIALTTFTGCSSEKKAKWTILVYMAADNTLSEAAIDELNEMEKAMFSDDINLIVQIDSRAGNFYNFYEGTRRYHIFPDSDNSSEVTSKVVKSMGEKDTGDYGSISDFANWGFDKYPSEKKALFIWSHGNNWYPSYTKFCPDHSSDNYINVPEKDLQKGFKNIDGNLDLLIYDACNMLSMEIIGESYKYADYIIGSEDLIHTDGFPYDDLMNGWENYSSTQNLASWIGTTFVDSYRVGGSQNPFGHISSPASAGVFKSSKYKDLRDALIQFGVDYPELPATNEFEVARDLCWEFNDGQDDVDIREFFLKLAQQNISAEVNASCDQILQILDECFISQNFYNYLHEVGTAAIWFPNRDYHYTNMLPLYENLKFSETDWHNFISKQFAD